MKCIQNSPKSHVEFKILHTEIPSYISLSTPRGQTASAELRIPAVIRPNGRVAAFSSFSVSRLCLRVEAGWLRWFRRRRRLVDGRLIRVRPAGQPRPTHRGAGRLGAAEGQADPSENRFQIRDSVSVESLASLAGRRSTLRPCDVRAAASRTALGIRRRGSSLNGRQVPPCSQTDPALSFARVGSGEAFSLIPKGA